MPCKHPLIRAENMKKIVTAQDGHKYYKPMIIGLDKFNEWEMDKHHPNYNYKLIPCGKCIGCRLDYSREWANRGFLEALCWKQNYFVTLTYNDEHLKMIREELSADEFYATVDQKDMKRFMHDLRQKMKRDKHQEDGIRFMGCAEYGDQGLRPHMHIILFNCKLPLESFYKPRILNDNTYYQNHIIEACWKKGLSNISEATWNTIAYTARYITKKIKGKDAQAIYDSLGVEAEFLRTSRMPGIGKPYYDKHWEKIYKYDQIQVHNLNGTITCQPPKYFDELYKKDHPKEFRKIQEKRERRARNINRLRDTQTSLTRLEQLEIEEATLQDKSLQLIRQLEK